MPWLKTSKGSEEWTAMEITGGIITLYGLNGKRANVSTLNKILKI